MSFLAPALLAGLAALALPILIHLVQRERRRVVPFPSLMFLRRIPYRSVRRRRIRDWLLLAVRLAALLLVAVAFARPFFERGTLASAVGASGGREVVILLDRSASMAYGDRFSRATAAARAAIDRLGAGDRATLVLFDTSAEETVRSTGDRARLAGAVAAARPGSAATRYAPALKLATSILAKSSLGRRETILISDFQRSGWTGDEDVRFAQGTVLTPVSVASADARNLSIPSVALARAPFSGQERITVTAAIRNEGPAAARVPVSLQVGSAMVETVDAEVPADASASVAFAPFTLGAPGLTATVRAGTDAMPSDNAFRFVLAPAATLAVLLVDDGRGSPSSLYLTRALSIGTAPRFAVDAVAPTAVTPALLASHPVVILNGAAASSEGSPALARFVEDGGGLLTILGGGSGTPGAVPADPLPRAASGDERDEPRPTSVGFVDYSHPIFEIFQGPHGGDFSGAHVYRYRPLNARPGDRILARFSDGGVALIERRLGAGRAIAWSSTFDDSWNDVAVTPVFLPLVQRIVRYLARYQDSASWRTVGQALDLDAGPEARAAGAARSDPAARLVLTPSGRRLDRGADGRPLRFVELDEQGFYQVRRPGGRVDPIAVNLDPAESDLAPLDPQELVGAVTGRAQPGSAAAAAPPTREDLERRQSLWWYLLFAALLVLAADSVLANRAAGTGPVVGQNAAAPRAAEGSAGRPSGVRTREPDSQEGRAHVAG